MFIESSANVSSWSSGGAKFLIADAAPNGAGWLMFIPRL